MIYQTLLPLLLLLLTAVPVAGQRSLGVRPTSSGGPLMPEQAAYDVTFYDLSLRVHPAEQTIDGTLTVHARIVQPIDVFVLDLDTLLSVRRIERIVPSGPAAPLSFERVGGKLRANLQGTLQPGERIAVQVAYGGAPRVAPRPPWAGGFTWAETSDGQPWIATSVQSDGADLWWPCKDHPSDEPDSMALHITVPEPLVVAANGRLRSVTPGEAGTRTYHWFTPNPVNNYGVALNIAPYRTLEGTYQSITGETIPITYWVLPENYEKGQALFPQFAEHLAFYEDVLGPYPWRNEKYGVAETPFLGMEHQTIIAYGSDYTNNAFGFDGLHHHELGHEWWGNLVTALDWRDFWIHEGFCSYMQVLYAERLMGEDGYRRALGIPRSRNLSPVAVRESQTTTEAYFVPPDYTESDGDMWNKGRWILHTLRRLIGDDAFFTALRRMAYPTPGHENATDGAQARFATTDDFLRIAEEASGRDLDWFFEVYLRRAALPELEARSTSEGLELHWKTPDDLPFPMPLDVQLGDTVRRVEMTNNRALIPLRETDTEPIVDPDHNVLRAGMR